MMYSEEGKAIKFTQRESNDQSILNEYSFSGSTLSIIQEMVQTEIEDKTDTLDLQWDSSA